MFKGKKLWLGIKGPPHEILQMPKIADYTVPRKLGCYWWYIFTHTPHSSQTSRRWVWGEDESAQKFKM